MKTQRGCAAPMQMPVPREPAFLTRGLVFLSVLFLFGHLASAGVPNFDLAGFATLDGMGQGGTTGGASGPLVRISTLNDLVLASRAPSRCGSS